MAHSPLTLLPIIHLQPEVGKLALLCHSHNITASLTILGPLDFPDNLLSLGISILSFFLVFLLCSHSKVWFCNLLIIYQHYIFDSLRMTSCRPVCLATSWKAFKHPFESPLYPSG